MGSIQTQGKTPTVRDSPQAELASDRGIWPARRLLERLWLGKEQVLAFLDDLAIPFD